MRTRTKYLLGTLAAGALATTLVVGHAQAQGGRGWGGHHGQGKRMRSARSTGSVS